MTNQPTCEKCGRISTTPLCLGCAQEAMWKHTANAMSRVFGAIDKSRAEAAADRLGRDIAADGTTVTPEDQSQLEGAITEIHAKVQGA